MVYPSPNPYRDDRPSLLAEIQRLQEQLSQIRSHRLRVAGVVGLLVFVLGIDAVLLGVVRSLINAPSDGRAFMGFGLVAVIVVMHLVLAIRVASRRR